MELSDVSGRRKSNMTDTEPEIFISRLLFGHSAVELMDPENMGVAVSISLLSCIKAEINVNSHLCPVTGCHF